jgi:hypothetical protein
MRRFTGLLWRLTKGLAYPAKLRCSGDASLFPKTMKVANALNRPAIPHWATYAIITRPIYAFKTIPAPDDLARNWKS